MINPRKRRILKLRMWFKQSGCCFWCHCFMHFGQIDKSDRTYATIDHLKTKNQGRQSYMEGGHVLACRACNVERNRQERYEMGKDGGKKIIQFKIDRIWNDAIMSLTKEI